MRSTQTISALTVKFAVERAASGRALRSLLSHQMHITENPFLDRSEPNPDGSFDYWHAGSIIVFSFDDGRSLNARRYSDSPSEAALFLSTDGPYEGDRETAQAGGVASTSGLTAFVKRMDQQR